MKTLSQSDFNKNYQTPLKHLRLKGLQPSRAGIACPTWLLDFSNLLDTHSWSTVKLDLYGLKFFYTHVLHKRWVEVNLIKPPKMQRLPDIITVSEAHQLFQATKRLS